MNGQHSSLCGELNFVDFLPQCLDPGGLFVSGVFEPFNVLIDRANAWLQETPNQEVKTCESVEFKNKCNEINYEKMTYLDYGQYHTYFVRGLRLWTVPRSDPSRPPQQIGYVNVVPQELPTGDMETLDLVLDRFNKNLLILPIPVLGGSVAYYCKISVIDGQLLPNFLHDFFVQFNKFQIYCYTKLAEALCDHQKSLCRILTVETQEMKIPSVNDFDPDKSSWVEKGQFSNKFVYVIRVFYEVSEPANEVIGIASFVPKLLKERSMLSFPEYEPFSNVICSAFQWCAQQTEMRFCNAQSVEIKMKSGNVIDTQRMAYTDVGNRGIFYARILRIAYTKLLPNSVGNVLNNMPVLNLTCKTFVPLLLVSRGLRIPEFESLSQTKQRIVAWVKATGARVVSAETCAVHYLGDNCTGHDSSFTYVTGDQEEYWIFIIRLFLDGFYPEPPLKLLPPMPTVQKDDSCGIL